jgi:hypothetical protein
MTANSIAELEREFTATHGGKFMSRYGAAGQATISSKKKVCFVATDKPFLVQLLYELSLRDDCQFVKYSVEPCDGMYLGRCFLVSDDAAGRLCQQYKPHPKLMVTLQDDEFFAAFREHGLPNV